MTSESFTRDGHARLLRLEEAIIAFLALEPPSTTCTSPRDEVDAAVSQSRQRWETGLLAIHELHQDELFRFAAPPDNQSVGTYFHSRFGLAQGDLSDMLECAQVLIDLRSLPAALESPPCPEPCQTPPQELPSLPPPPSMDVALAIGAAAPSRNARQQLWAEIVRSLVPLDDAATDSTVTAASTSPLPLLSVPIAAVTPFHVHLVASTLFPSSGTSTPGSLYTPNRGRWTSASASNNTSPTLPATQVHDDTHVGQPPCAPVVSRARRCEPCPRANSPLSLLSAPVPSIELPMPVPLPRRQPTLVEEQVQKEDSSELESVPPSL
ncbi:hypothetical protein BCR44DRAFT_85939 [Catenaria anguillulae PL171]|uniref:Uncharacterized protein n=1 Tax=Catenaria anguillulae PL171 TaxID=765915 RepID=A0A1Y2HHY0_9FUNG|nr:hypothetical protein BCR44DRAFT_85939 [Catenaria anguillulae PL171]